MGSCFICLSAALVIGRPGALFHLRLLYLCCRAHIYIYAHLEINRKKSNSSLQTCAEALLLVLLACQYVKAHACAFTCMPPQILKKPNSSLVFV